MAKYNINALIEATNEYFYAEEEREKFLKTWTGGWWPNKTAQEREDYTRYTERRDCKWDALRTMCRLVNVDIDMLLVMCKAINRWEKNQNWQICVHIWRTEQNIIRALENLNEWEVGYYQSTGRKITA